MQRHRYSGADRLPPEEIGLAWLDAAQKKLQQERFVGQRDQRNSRPSSARPIRQNQSGILPALLTRNLENLPP